VLEKNPEIHKELWGAFFERDGRTIHRFDNTLPDFEWDKKWIICRFHACHQAQADEFRKYLPYTDVLLGTHEKVVGELRRHFPDHPRIDLCGFGVATYWQYPPPQPSPYEPGTTNLIWAGRLDTTHEGGRLYIFRKIFERDPSIKIHIISQSEIQGALDQDKLPPNCIFHGPMQSGTFNHFIYYADLALDVGMRRMRWLNCKNYSYLGMGCPVVTNPVPGTEIIEETGQGILVDTFDRDDHVDAVFEALQREWRPRDEVIAYMQAHHGWDKPAAALEKYIKQGIELGFDRPD
jgi:hypothetical protein